ncbi:MAG: ribosome biogenesis GTP-binding protein YsxC [Bacilli bacterium]|nr:ribosome biogenesis GTP-binding protein YsxC [Bacilli bacterium]
MLNFHDSKFLKSVFDAKLIPKDKKTVIFVGRSNVGKSSLINALCENSKMARVSSKPGKTISLNYFLINKKIYFVDTPGYGYSSKPTSFTQLMESFFVEIKYITKCVVFVLDSRRNLMINDKVFYNNFLIDKNIKFFIVLTKKDKIDKQQYDAVLRDINKNFKIVKNEEIFFSSIKDSKSINKIKKQINFFYLN